MKVSVGEMLERELAIVSRTGNRFKDVFAGSGNFAGISVGGGRTGTGGGAGGQGAGPVVVIAGAGEEGGDEVVFDPMLDEVRPGDLITSDFMLRLLARVNRLEAVLRRIGEGGAVAVPDFFGVPFQNAIDAVQKSGGKLKFGLMIDTTGQQIDVATPGKRVVLGQHPAPGDEVDEGTVLNLLVSPAKGGTGDPVPSAGGGGQNLFRSEPGGPAAGASDAGELERATDDDAQTAAGTKSAPRGASKSRKSRKSPAK